MQKLEKLLATGLSTTIIQTQKQNQRTPKPT